MSGPMSVSMTIKLIDEASAGARGVATALREVKEAGESIGRIASGRPGEWEAERGAVQGVVAEVRTLGSLRQDTSGITAATSAFREETSAVESLADMVRRVREERRASFRASQAEAAAAAEGVTASVQSLGEAQQGDAGTTAAIGRFREEGAAVDNVIGKLRELGELSRTSVPSVGTGIGGPAAPVDWGDRAGRNQDWGAYWQQRQAQEMEGGAAGSIRPRASDWVAQRRQMDEVGEAAERATNRVEELEHSFARLGMAGMAFGQVRGFGEDIRRPVAVAGDVFTDFQAKTQDLATRSENNGGQKEVGDHILKVARDANVPWEQVYEGEQSLASLGGGHQLKAMAGFETRMNQLALAGNIEAKDVYSAMMHYIKGGLSASEAMDTLEQQHVQGQRGSVELNQLSRFMPSIMALGKEFGMTPKQASLDASALMQIARENVGTAGEAATLVREGMTKLSDPRTVKRLEADLGIDGFQVRADAKARGENPLFALLNAIADKFQQLTPEQKGTVTRDGEGHGIVSGGDPKIMGDLARDYRFRALLDAFIQHRSELPEFNIPVEEARVNTDASYAAQNSTVKQAKQSAENRKVEAEVRAGETQAPVMKSVAGAQGGAWDAGAWMAEHFPRLTGVAGFGSNAIGSSLDVVGRIGEAAIGVATAWKAAQYVGAKYPMLGEIGGVVRGAATVPLDIVKGVAGGVVDGIKQAKAEAANAQAEAVTPKPAPNAAEPASTTGAAVPQETAPVAPEAVQPGPTTPLGGAEPAAGGLTKVAAAATDAAGTFGKVSVDLGTIGMLATWAAKSDVGLHRPLSDESLAQNPLGIRLPGDPGTLPRSVEEPAAVMRAVQQISVALEEQAHRAAVEFRRDPEAARGRAMMDGDHSGGALPALGVGAIQAAMAPLQTSIKAAIADAFAARTVAAAKPTAELPQQVTNNQQRYITAPVTVSAPVTINATLNNTTPAAIGSVVQGAVHAGVRAGAAALHDGTETR